ncbi:MAG: prolyl oligopeptidase family serine peptidase [Candidatus Binatia bacterium]|nr:prolyl oligopeptidase family serine peptidase [Candidatus Binatia bacterium]
MKNRIWISLLVLGAIVASAPRAAAAPGKSLPVEAYAQDGYLRGPALSPSGRYIAGVVHHEGQNLVLVWDLETDKRAPIARLDSTKQYLHGVQWANEDRILATVSWPNNYTYIDGSVGRRNWMIGMDRNGDNQRLFGKNWFGGRGSGKSTSREIRLPQVRSGANVLDRLDAQPDRVLLQIDRYDKSGAAAYSMDTNSGRLRREVATETNIIRYLADHDGAVRMGFGSERKGGKQWLIARTSEDDRWETVASWNILKEKDARTITPLGFSFDKNIVYVSKRSPSGTAGVYEFDISAKKLGKLVYSHPKYDVHSLIFDKKRKVLEGVYWLGDTYNIHFLDKQSQREFDAIRKALGGGNIFETSRSLDEKRKLYYVDGPEQTPRIYLYDRPTKNIRELYSKLPMIRDGSIARVRKINFKTRDGYPLEGYLTLPKNGPAKNLPTIIYPHGGPWARDSQHFDRTTQFLADNGFAVLQINFRGSEGLGEEHMKAGYRQVGDRIQDDITDGTRWIIEQGIADPERVAIYGASHGGYASLMGLAKHPELYRCGAALAPVTDMYDMVNRQRWLIYGAANKLAWGDLRVEGEAERLRQNSPINLVAKIEDPVLLAHGRHDGIVPHKHSVRMQDALEDAEKKSEIVLYEDWHGFIHQPNRIDFYTRLRDFLQTCTA